MKTGIYRECPRCSYPEYELGWESKSLKICPCCQCDTAYAKIIKIVDEKSPTTRRDCIICGTTTMQTCVDGKWECSECY